VTKIERERVGKKEREREREKERERERERERKERFSSLIQSTKGWVPQNRPLMKVISMEHNIK